MTVPLNIDSQNILIEQIVILPFKNCNFDFNIQMLTASFTILYPKKINFHSLFSKIRFKFRLRKFIFDNQKLVWIAKVYFQ